MNLWLFCFFFSTPIVSMIFLPCFWISAKDRLAGYEFSISSTPDQRVLGEIDINLSLVPAFEITQINIVVSLEKEL